MKGTLLIVIALLVIGVLILLFDANVEEGVTLPDVDVETTVDGETQLPMYDVDVEQTQEGNIPDVDVETSVTGGSLPEVDITGPSADIETETMEVEVPTDVDINLPEDTK